MGQTNIEWTSYPKPDGAMDVFGMTQANGGTA